MAKLSLSNNALLMGALYLIIGILLAVLGKGALNIVLIIAGVLILISGALGVYECLKSKNNAGLVGPAINVALGLVLIILPNLLVDVLMILLAILLIVLGITTALSINVGVKMPKTSKTASIVIGVVMVVLGVLALVDPSGIANMILVIIGIVMAVLGVLNIVAALK